MAVAINTSACASDQSTLYAKYDLRLKPSDVTGVRAPEKSFYVYMYRDTRPGKNDVPIYVGKGHDGKSNPTQRRARLHWNQAVLNIILSNIFNQMRCLGIKPKLEIVDRFYSEVEAFEFETKLIAEIGRVSLGSGTLCNFADGGAGRVGSTPSEETRMKLSDACKRSHASPEVRAKIAAASRQMHSDPVFAARRAKSLSMALQDPKWKAARSQLMKEIHSRTGERERRYKSLREAWDKPGARDARSALAKEMQSRPEVKLRHAEGLRRRHANPENKEKHRASLVAMHERPEIKEKHKNGCIEFRLRQITERKMQMLQYLMPTWIF